MHSNLFGQFLLERGTIDSDQLRQALDYQRAHNRVLGELAVEKGFLDDKAISKIIEHQRLVDKDFGGIAVELGLMTRETLDELLSEQQRSHLRLGEVLVKLSYLDREKLEEELDVFEELRIVGGPDEFPDEQAFKENPALGLFNLTSRVLPRMTRGLFLPGGFYPTISSAGYDFGFSQRVRGDLDMEVVLIINSRIFSLLCDSNLTKNGKQLQRKSKTQSEQSIKSMINVIMRLFVQQQERFGLKLDLSSSPSKIQESTFLKHKQKAQSTTSVEVFLISPHDPSGDLLEFYMSAIFR